MENHQATDSSTFNKIFYHPITRIILNTVAIVAITGLVKEFITKPFFTAISPTEYLPKVIVPILSAVLMVAVYYLLVKYYEKASFTDFDQKPAAKEVSLGFLLGFGVISAVVLILYLGGYYKIIDSNTFGSFLPTISFIMGAAVLEELVFRGVIFNILEKWKGSGIAVIASAIIFQLPHFMNPHEAFLPATLGFIFGLLHALLYMDTRRLWIPIAFHMGWNLAQPFFGTTLSGIDGFGIFYHSEMQGPELLTGSAFGVEDSLLSMAVLLGLSWVYYTRVKKKGIWVNRSDS